VAAAQASDVETVEIPADLTVASAPSAGLEDYVVFIKDILGGNFLTHRIYSP
jgi:hypothetical protein